MTLHPTTREKQKDMVQKTNLIAQMSSARTNYLQMVFKIAKAIQMKKKNWGCAKYLRFGLSVSNGIQLQTFWTSLSSKQLQHTFFFILGFFFL